MIGIDDNVYIIGDWIPPTPTPRTYFTAILGDDLGSKLASKTPVEEKTEGLFQGSPQSMMTAENSDNKVMNHGMSRGQLLGKSQVHGEVWWKGWQPELAQPSPTTGKFPFIPNVVRNCNPESHDKSDDNHFEDNNASSFAFKPIAESNSSFLLSATSKVNPAGLPQQSFPNAEASVQSEISYPSRSVDPRKLHPQNRNMFSFKADFSRPSMENDTGSNNSTDQRVFDPVGENVEHSLPLDERQDEGDQRVSCEAGGTPSEDGYNWRKYGQKQVKGSEYPRSYYKCTHPTCPVKKKVEHSHEGHITEIIYKGAHNHPKPPPNHRSSNLISDMQLELTEQTGLQNVTHDNIEMTSSATKFPENDNGQAPNTIHIGSGDAVDVSSTFSNNEDDQGTHGSVSLRYNGEGDESESKRRKIESYATKMSGATRAIREPRVVVQTTSEVDILDDGYWWRKYGQKVVKGNPNPRFMLLKSLIDLL